MKVIIKLPHLENINAVLRALLSLIQGDNQIQQTLLTHGLLFENLSESEVTAIQRQLDNLRYSGYKTTQNAIRILTVNNDLNGSLKVVVALLRTDSELAKVLWDRGLVIEHLAEAPANALKKNLEAASAQVTLIPEIRQISRPFIVQGTVTQEDGRIAPFLTVRAFHVQNSREILLGETQTNEKGFYSLSYLWDSFASMPHLIIRVYGPKNDVIGGDRRSGATSQETINIIVKPYEDSQPIEDQFIVQGFVRQSNGAALPGLLVEAFDIDLRQKQLLGQTQTDKKGFYQIQYTTKQFSNLEKGSADLRVQVSEIGGSTLAISDIWFNAPPVAEIDLTIPDEHWQAPTLFERIQRDLEPLLGDLNIEALEENEQHQDLTFLSGETGFAQPTLARFAIAHKLSEQGMRSAFWLEPEFWFAQLGETFFQYTPDQSLQEQAQAILDTLDNRTVRQALIQSFRQKEISEKFENNVDRWVDLFLQYVAHLTISDTNNPTFVRLALEDAKISDTQKQIKFARLFNQHKALTPTLLDELEQDPAFQKPEIDDLRTSYQLGELTQGDFSVVRSLKADFGIRQPAQIRTLAKRSETEWVSWVQIKADRGEMKLPVELGAIAQVPKPPEAEVYGKMLERQFREAFPTTAFTGGLERALQNGGSRGLRRAQDLNRFLERHEDFEWLNTPVDEFLNTQVHREFRDLARDEDFRVEMKAAQRVFKLAPTFAATDTLLADDLHSAQKIYRLGKSEFVRQYGDRPGFTRETAQLAWNRAAETHAAVLTIVADLKALDVEALPMALKSGSDALSGFPNWNNLFKAGDLCDCAHCRSVLSPAAYFADLLMFLKDRKAKNPANSVKDILFERRPDLGFLELNCDNALVPLPYIDVVCEVLEAAIDSTGENDVELTGLTTIPADPNAAQTAVLNAFAVQSIRLGETFSLSQVTPANPDHWVVHGDEITYRLQKKPPSPNFFARILRNTKGSAAELRAYPQYVNPVVYHRLKAERYPLSLPFDLFAEEVRVSFQKTNLHRWDLMRTFQGAGAPNNPTLGDIAAEYFGISVSAEPADPSEKSLVLEAAPAIAEQQARWGETGATWLATLSNVKTFLQKTQLKYTDLLTLLDLSFINPTGSLALQHLDASCDLDQKVIQGLDASALDRLYRFLRLWRKLKTWTMAELDLVLRHPRLGDGSLNEGFLIHLFYFSEVQKKLGARTTVEQVCALLGDLNIETRFTQLHQKRENALYQDLFLNRRLVNPLNPAFQLDPVTGDLPPGEVLSDHHPVLLAALRIREADLEVFKTLTRTSDDLPYITDDLTLAHLSFLWRHSWLSKALRLKAEEWKTLLKLLQQDLLAFVSPQDIWEFLETMDRIKATGLSPDDLNWLLAGDRTSKSALRETDALRFLATLRQSLQAIQSEFNLPLPTQAEELAAMLVGLLQRLNRSEIEVAAVLEIIRAGEPVASMPAEFLVKFHEPNFSASILQLPASIDFPTQLSADLAAKISYDPEQRLLHFRGIMTAAEQAALLDLSDDGAYGGAIASLATQPQTILPPDERIWLTDAELDATQPDNDTEVKRFSHAVSRALAYLLRTRTENTIVQQISAQLGLSEALTRRVLTHYPVLPDSLLSHFAGIFALDTITLQGWYWVNRVSLLLKQWRLTLTELDSLVELVSGAQLLDFQSLPLDSEGAIASLDQFLRTHQLLKLRDSLPEANITLLEVLERLHRGDYGTAADFAADVEQLNPDWLATEVEALIDALDLTYPDAYLLAESWERLRRAFYYLGNLNAGTNTVKTFAASAMDETHAGTLKELLRSKFGPETWLTLSAEIQDGLRERKRDALAAYLLTQPQPTDAPSGKWENTNDLYSYYLLDVEMSSCQLTSRLVQASGSVQLFVQRCFMGLEPRIEINADGADGDSAWRWWKWMRKYRVWEANRKVFLWPENWVEPELKPDRSSFFKDLENELLQNEINEHTVETAFVNYLEKLDNVAQLEISGFYQEDDGDNAIIHVFGRTTGAEPHLYYYRRYDYRQWTPWEKVDLDIQGDYLIPAVVNKRLFLFWPVFTEVPDDSENSKPVPIPASGATTASVKPTLKRLKLQLAVSDYRQGKWTPKRISKDAHESALYTGEIVKLHYQFLFVDRSNVDGRFGISYSGFGRDTTGNGVANLGGAFAVSGCKGIPERTTSLGFFQTLRPESYTAGQFPVFAKWKELSPRSVPSNDFALQPSIPVLSQTPGLFQMTPPWHLSYFDQLWLNGLEALASLSTGSSLASNDRLSIAGLWLPFFYNDQKRTFFVLPAFWDPRRGDSLALVGNGGNRYYYPEIKQVVREWEDLFAGWIQTWLDSIDLSNLTTVERQALEQLLYQQFAEDTPPPSATPPSYTDTQVKALMKRWMMRFVHALLGAASLFAFQFRRFHFKNFYHPLVCDFAKLVHNPLQGIPALMSRETQLKNTGFRFQQHYQPTPRVVNFPAETFYPQEEVDFTPDGAYSPYNWELFFHAPLLIANSLSQNQRFEEARDWYHFMFNPIGIESGVPGGSPMSRYWITKPFFETTETQYLEQRIENLLRLLAGDTSIASTTTQQELIRQVKDWRTHPFEPHRIANYRTVAYQKTVVMKYLDNLIAWGDHLFRQDSMESINEATQLYILAAEILGPRPQKVPPQTKPPVESFNELETEFDAFSNALVEVENIVPVLPGDSPEGADPAPLPMLYFCIPHNEKMLGYWDTVVDRLYKIRNCMNIEGVVRQLALFEPPIDPGALVKAVAGGMDLSSALADLNAPLPLYRFNILLQKANEVCNDVKALGSALLAALEKKDAEALSLLRQNQEIRLLEAMQAIRTQQVEEAKETLESIKKSQELAELKKTYYENREFMNAGEIVAIALNTASTVLDIPVSIGYITGGVLKAIPNFLLGASGFGGSPHATAETGGSAFGDAAKFAAEGLGHIARNLDKMASLSSTVAGYQRRQEDWDFQKDLAIKEIEQLEEQITAAEIRIAIAEKELENHQLQIENAQATDEFMRSKYTNQELYQWQIGQISGVYFQSYQLAYDLAKRAERCFRFELGLQDSSYIQFGYWDSLKKGLLSGEKLQYDLRRLESAYLDQHRREFELTKSISLALLDPLALIQLRETGRCFLRLPEEIFDLDYPGHYFRRIKSVSLTLPCVVGPYTTISCTLRLLKNSLRINTANGDDGYPRNTDDQGFPTTDERFVENNIPVKAIATSTGQNDSGIFELNFRDERYLPFEGAGTISEWSLELFNDLPANNPDPGNPDFGRPLRQFDYSTITDAILHVKYTAREDAGPFKNGAIAHLRDYFSQADATPALRMLNLRQEFPSQWHRFLNPTAPAEDNVLELPLSASLFPVRDQGKTLKMNTLWLLARCTDAGSYTATVHLPDSNELSFALNRSAAYGGLHVAQQDISALGVEVNLTDGVIPWHLTLTSPSNSPLQNQPPEVEDWLIVLGYEWG
jgi:hypothetical protein